MNEIIAIGVWKSWFGDLIRFIAVTGSAKAPWFITHRTKLARMNKAAIPRVNTPQTEEISAILLIPLEAMAVTTIRKTISRIPKVWLADKENRCQVWVCGNGNQEELRG